MQINEMSRKVLKSIEAAIFSSKDNGECLREVLCQNTIFYTNNENEKIWLPIWR